MMICTLQLSDISSHLLFSNVGTMPLMHPPQHVNASPRKLKLSVGTWGVQKAPSLRAIIPGTCRDDSESEMLSWKINYFIRDGTQAGDSELD